MFVMTLDDLILEAEENRDAVDEMIQEALEERQGWCDELKTLIAARDKIEAYEVAAKTRSKPYVLNGRWVARGGDRLKLSCGDIATVLDKTADGQYRVKFDNAVHLNVVAWNLDYGSWSLPEEP